MPCLQVYDSTLISDRAASQKTPSGLQRPFQTPCVPIFARDTFHHNPTALRIPPADVQVDDTTLDVTELPLRKWTQDYKEFLEGLIKPEEKAGPAILADYREHHSDADVHFSLQLLPGQMDPCLAAGLHSKFKLLSKISCGELGRLTPIYPHYLGPC